MEPALVAAGMVEAGTADQVRADLELAVAVRQPGHENQAGLGGSGLPPDARKQLAGLMHNPSRLAGTVAAYFPGLALSMWVSSMAVDDEDQRASGALIHD